MDPDSKKFIQAYGEKGSPRHERAKRMQQLGGYARLGLGAAGAVNSAYNQMASGQPGLGGAISSGAMSGYYGSAGLEDFAARLGQRFGRKLSDKKLSNSTALIPMNRTDTSDPTVSDEQRYQDLVNEFEAGRDPNITPSSPPPANFTQIAEPNAQMLPSPQGISTFDKNPVASSTVKKPVGVMRGDPMRRIQSDFGDPVPDETMDRIMEDFS